MQNRPSGTVNAVIDASNFEDLATPVLLLNDPPAHHPPAGSMSSAV